MTDFETQLRGLVRDIVRDELARAKSAIAGEEYLSPEHAARVADVAPATIRRWVREGKLSRHAAGAHVRVVRSELEQLLATPVRQRDTKPASTSITDIVRRRIAGRTG